MGDLIKVAVDGSRTLKTPQELERAFGGSEGAKLAKRVYDAAPDEWKQLLMAPVTARTVLTASKFVLKAGTSYGVWRIESVEGETLVCRAIKCFRGALEEAEERLRNFLPHEVVPAVVRDGRFLGPAGAPRARLLCSPIWVGDRPAQLRQLKEGFKRFGGKPKQQTTWEESLGRTIAWTIFGVVLLLLVLVCCSLAIQVPGNSFTVDLNPNAFVEPLSERFKTTADLQSDKAGSATEVTKMATFPDVVVVGGGLAGLSAAVEVVKRGGSVLVLEKSERLGGNSGKASSGMNAARSGPQLASGIEDKLEDFAKDTQKSGKGLSDMALVDVIVKQSADAVAFLEGFQIDLSSIAQLGGHSHPRTHRSKPDGKPMNIGFRIMSVLIKYVEALPADKAKVVKQARVTALLTDDSGAVTGVKYETPAADGSGGKEETEVKASAVILATGGYSADKAEGGLLDQHTPKLRNLATTNGPFATGDGVRLGLAAGAGLIHMDQVQLHPTGYVDPKDPRNPVKFLAPEALRGCGGILLNEKGDRFVNELTTRDAVVEAILKYCGPLPEVPDAPAGGADMPAVSYLILNQEAINKFDPLSCQFYIGKGLIRKFDSVEALSEGTKLPAANVKAALDSYGHHDAEKGDPFGKTVFPVLFNASEPPLYVAIITPSLHYCMGGLKFDTNGRILKEDGAPIPGLFGAGEVTGGLHGANRLGGNSLLECVVYGRVAGISAFDRIGKSAV
ncbi:unnamed protein product [Closterium sp. Naga37s-1]|nr:unnamed protein product [Closterium sp. Naga37s-1]